MRLKIEIDGTLFRVAGPVRPKQDYKDKERQATTRDGEPIWTVRLDAIEPEREARETIWVDVVIPGVPATVGQTAVSGTRPSDARAMLNTGSRNSAH